MCLAKIGTEGSKRTMCCQRSAGKPESTLHRVTEKPQRAEGTTGNTPPKSSRCEVLHVEHGILLEGC